MGRKSGLWDLLPSQVPWKVNLFLPRQALVWPRWNDSPALSHLLFCTNSAAIESLLQRGQYRQGRTQGEDSSTCTFWNIWAGLSDKEGGPCSLLPAPAYWTGWETWPPVTAPANRSLLQEELQSSSIPQDSSWAITTETLFTSKTCRNPWTDLGITTEPKLNLSRFFYCFSKAQ